MKYLIRELILKGLYFLIPSKLKTSILLGEMITLVKKKKFNCKYMFNLFVIGFVYLFYKQISLNNFYKIIYGC